MAFERRGKVVVVSVAGRWGADVGNPGEQQRTPAFSAGARVFLDVAGLLEIRYVHCLHEEAASLAAVGHAKFTGKLAVCISTAGPGAVHMLNGMYDAKMEQAP